MPLINGHRGLGSARFRKGTRHLLESELGASVCAYYRGEKVVDLWAGYKDAAREDPWLADTLVNVYSTTKGLAALAIAVLYDEGLIDYTAPVAQYWPEFGAAGKSKVTVAELLAHKAKK